MGDAVAEDYKSSLADLNCNSKPAINCMTMLADENIQYAPNIVKVIVEHIQSIPAETKLPVLYLIDSIIKNVGKQYLTLFSQSITSIFATVFEKVDENTRALMYKLRQTWSGIFPNKILYSIDTRVKQVDPAWPITAQPPTPSIHINPKFLPQTKVEKPASKQLSDQTEESAKLKAAQSEVLKQLFEKQKTLRELEEKKRELAAKQFLSTQLTHVSSEPSAETRVGDPRMHAQLNPTLTQRDPRVQKALSALLHKKTTSSETSVIIPSDSSQTSAKEPKKIPSVIATSISNVTTATISSVITAKPTVSIPSALISSVVQRQENSRSSLSKSTSSDSIDKENSQKTHKQTVFGSKKEFAKDSSKTTRLDPRTFAQTKATSTKRKRRSEEKTDDDKADGSVSSPKKPHREKGLKKKENSPKNKSLDKSENSKDSKKHNRSRSRSPIQRVMKNRGKASEADPRIKRKDNCIPETKPKEIGEEPGRKKEGFKIPKDTKKTTPAQDSEAVKENVEDSPKEMTESQEKADVGMFGRQDQDYRQMPKGQKSSPQKGWAMYKAAHPDQFKMPLRPMAGNDKRSFDEFKKMPPRYGRGFYDDGGVEYDRLGRPRLPRMRAMHARDFLMRFPPRDFDFRFPGRNSFMDRRLHDIFSGNPKDVLRQAEEQYNSGRITENEFQELQRELERVWASEEYQHFKEIQQNMRNLHPYEKYSVPYRDRDREMFHNRMDPGFPPHPVEGHQLRIGDRGLPSKPPPDTCTFRLDNKNRIIHFIDERAVVLLDNNEARELVFRGQPSQVEIEGLKPIMLRFDGKPVTFELNGKMYSIRFGAPSRELYINNTPYEGKFGGPPFEVVLNGQVRRVRLGGPQPQVQVSEHPVPEEIYRRIMARTRANNAGALTNPVLQQDVDMRDMDPTVSDIDLRLTGPKIGDTIDGQPQFRGGVRDMPVHFRGQPGFNVPTSGQPPMMGPSFREPLKDSGPWDHQGDPSKVPSVPELLRHPDSGRSQGSSTTVGSFNERLVPPNAPWVVRDYNQDAQRTMQSQPPESINMYSTHRNSPQQLDPHSREYPDATQQSIGPRPPINQHGVQIQSRLPHPPLPPWLNNPTPADQSSLPLLPPPPRPPMLIGVGAPSDMNPVPVSSGALTMPTLPVPAGVSGSTTSIPPLTGPPPPFTSVQPPAAPFDIGTLFDKLLAAGIISKPSAPVKEETAKKEEEEKAKEKKADEDDDEPEDEEIPPIEWKMDSLKKHYSGVTSILYKGSECQSCGMRFRDPERYSRHLDWHFRMNRREKDGVKKAFSRKWYYEVEDWIQFEEFADIDERARSFFEMEADQQFQMDEPDEQPSIPTMGREAEACVVCGEAFKLFWVEEEEEWHLRNAVRHDEQAYHPSCYEDFKKASEKAEAKAAEAEAKAVEEETTTATIKEEPHSPVEEPMIQDDSNTANVDADIASIKIEIDDSVTDLMHSLVTLVVEGSEVETQTKLSDEEEVTEKVVEEAEDEVLQGKPGEEEIIGVITEHDDMDTDEHHHVEESEKVVIESGGIVMKFRAGSLKPASPVTDANAEKDSVVKDKNIPEVKKEESDEEDDEFRPPTPDPRFKQMPPVQKGVELSGMCCIM